MHRELNPELFGVKSLQEEAPLGFTGSQASEPLGLQTASGSRIAPQAMLEMKALEAQIHQLRIQLQATEKRSELLMNQMQELVRGANSRFERVGQTFVRIESSMHQQIQELNTKYSAVTSKVNERKVQDAKVQEMIDRHNNIVRTFENRLTHMQRVMSEQEMQLHNSQAALEEARHEIARLKQANTPRGI